MKKISQLFLLVCFICGLSFNLLKAEESEILAKSPVFSPDSKKIAFLFNKDHVKRGMYGGNPQLFELYTIDTNGNNLKKISESPDTSYFVQCFCWSPNGKRIAYSAGTAENTEEGKHLGSGIFIINSDGSNLRTFIDDEMTGEICWAPDGTNLAFTNSSGINIANSDKRYVLIDGTEPVWSPDSKQIAFERRKPLGPDFYTIDIDGKNEKAYKLENYLGSVRNGLNWSPDGTKMYVETPISVVVKRIKGIDKYFRIVVENNNTDFFSSSRDARLDSSLSPDGKEVIFLAYNDIYRVSSKPGGVITSGRSPRSKPVNLLNLTKTPQITEEKPLWSPDGQQIVFTISGEVWIMSSDGSNQTQLTNGQLTEKVAQE